ncbi:hypothetical protein MED121_12085 [Marinomonas sp. MED121]|uniref:hypothetical protein n=1 Tax=Marinomonas sp. MED121 TaxID=314277 RepID=UPI000068FF90|nr:hypothetical protein [Marinomonas sp. MED121]EAQ66663.1 hypothetical protein MED121_12085 [Marinomonas sp. MED121]
MLSELEKYLPNFDLENKQIAHDNALIEKIKTKADELVKENEAQYNILAFKARSQVELLKLRVKGLEQYIKDAISEHKKHSYPYDNYKEDLDFNLEELEARREQYDALYLDEKVSLIFEESGSILAPNQWSLDLDNLGELPEPFVPRCVRSVHTHKETPDKKTLVQFEKYYNYSNTIFRYADDGSVIHDRFVLYWKSHTKEALEAQSKTTHSFSPDYLRAAYIKSGEAQCTHFKETTYKNDFGNVLKRKYEDSELRAQKFELVKPVLTKGLMATSGVHNEYGHSDSIINLNSPTHFLLYPLDQGPFVTNKLDDLPAIKVPESEGMAQKVTSIVYDGGDAPAPKEIYLHCTLPEWNYRLKKALSDVEQQTNEYNLMVSPHLEKMMIAQEMKSLVDLHVKFPYFDSNNLFINTSKVSRRTKLSEALEDLYRGIDTVVHTPNVLNAPISDLALAKQDQESAAGKLYHLIRSPALLAELKHYVEHIESKEIEQGTMDAGPYMEKEDRWREIFITISRCYAALSHSELYGEMIWDEDLVYSIDSLSKLSGDKVDEQIKELWESLSDPDADRKHTEEDFKDVPEYLLDQSSSNFIEDNSLQTEMSLSSYIIGQYEVLAKPYLNALIPSAGAPCILQVILGSYDSFVNSHIKQALRTDLSYHIRMFKNVLVLFSILDGRDSITKLDVGSFLNIFKALIVTKDISASNKRGQYIVSKMMDFFASLDDDINSGKGTAHKFYTGISEHNNKLVSLGAAYGKVVYGLFNFALSIQQLQALEEKAVKENWSQGRLLTTYAASTVEVFQMTGSAAQSVFMVAARTNTFSHLRSSWMVKPEGLSSLLNKTAMLTGILQVIVSSFAAADHLKSGEYKKLFIDGLNIVAGSMLVASQILKLFAYRLALAGVLLVVGSVINIGLLALMLAELWHSKSKSASQNLLEGYWQEFLKDNSKLTRSKVEAYGLKVLNYDKVDDRVYQIETDLLYERGKGIEILTAYNKAPYDVYVGNLDKVGVDNNGNIKEARNIGFWSDEGLTKEPALIVNDLHRQDFFFDNDSVYLGKLSWRAIVPLLQMGYQESDIEDMVEFPTSWFNSAFFDGMKSVAQVIQYYNEVKAGDEKNIVLPKSKWNKAYYVDSLEQDGEGESAQPKSMPIYVLMERGTFLPPDHNLYYQSEKWNHDAFKQKKHLYLIVEK